MRLVLVISLASSALWAIVDFIALAISSPSACQVAVAFGAAFDQLARTALLQFLLWAVSGGMKLSIRALAPQAAVGLRFVLGAVYLGFQRADFNPVCIPSNGVLPLGISVVLTDTLIIMSLLAKVIWSARHGWEDAAVSETNSSRFVMLGIAGAGMWTAVSCITILCLYKPGVTTGRQLTPILQMSAPMILGVSTLDMLFRTLLPAIGVLLVIGRSPTSPSRGYGSDESRSRDVGRISLFF